MSQIVEKSSQIGRKLPRAPLGRESWSWREEEEEWGGGSSRGEVGPALEGGKRGSLPGPPNAKGPTPHNILLCMYVKE
jgi:hypothetical protein